MDSVREMHMCFIDLEKAYDELFEVLAEYKIPTKVICMMEHSKKIFQTALKLDSGVRQGCPSSCVLFSVWEWLET